MLAHLGIGEAVVAVAPVEAGIARLFTCAHAAEEGLKGMLNTQHDILQDLAVDLGIVGHGFFNAWQFGLLLVITHGDAAHPPGLAALANGRVVDVTAEHQRMVKQPLLLHSGLEFVLERLTDGLLCHALALPALPAQHASTRLKRADPARPPCAPR